MSKYNVPMNQDTIFEILSEPDIIKGRKLSEKKVHIKWGEGNLQPTLRVSYYSICCYSLMINITNFSSFITPRIPRQ